ncbi:hypothetical protein AQI95_06465 [Streptomyces yokosukanensis]|uniref:Uncharacterized protein n=1 Tax=Streptomyces yokosukanensis TaxID=67386 RepID=A0A101PDF6_9ACTN|nr:hypothetical protein AQI95_06465 [Streptomyces yokosukanensis]
MLPADIAHSLRARARVVVSAPHHRQPGGTALEAEQPAPALDLMAALNDSLQREKAARGEGAGPAP